jgi:uncharacterized protein YwgA
VNRAQRFSVIIELADEIRKAGSWSGETNLQKSLYFLQELFHVETDYQFVLYRHGPFSFELRDDLQVLQASGLVELVPIPPYGPQIRPTAASGDLQGHFPKTMAGVAPAIGFVADHLGNRDVLQLERLATALYVIKEGQPEANIELLAERLNQIKPHVPVDLATHALNEVKQLIQLAAVTH